MFSPALNLDCLCSVGLLLSCWRDGAKDEKPQCYKKRLTDTHCGENWYRAKTLEEEETLVMKKKPKHDSLWRFTSRQMSTANFQGWKVKNDLLKSKYLVLITLHCVAKQTVVDREILSRPKTLNKHEGWSHWNKHRLMPNPITTTPHSPDDALNNALLQTSPGREHGKMPASIHSVDSNQFIYLYNVCYCL